MKWICAIVALAAIGIVYATGLTQDKSLPSPLYSDSQIAQPPSGKSTDPTAIAIPPAQTPLDTKVPPATTNTPSLNIPPLSPPEEVPQTTTPLNGINTDFCSKTSRLGVWKIELIVSEGISNDGKWLILDNWLEEQASDVQYHPQTNMPIQPRKYKLTKQRFNVDLVNAGNILMNWEGRKLSIEQARAMLSVNNIVALVTSGEKPIPSVLRAFNHSTVIVIYRGISAQ